MPSCEKCWADSYTYTYGTPESRIECYQRLVKERDCTPEEQAGPDAGICPKCKKKSVHQMTHECMNCGLTSEQVIELRLVKTEEEANKRQKLTDILYSHADTNKLCIDEFDFENVINDIIEEL